MKIENLKGLMTYQSLNHENIEVLYEEENFWLTQKSMSELFGVGVNTINYHLKEIFKAKELQEESVIRKIRITANDGKKYDTNFYSLDAIIAVGYRVNSKEVTNFRIWVVKTLKECIQKECVVNSEMLRNEPKLGKDYFDSYRKIVTYRENNKMRKWVKFLYYFILAISTLVGLWHFFVPRMFQWYDYLPAQYENLIVAIDWTNYCFSILLFGLSLLLIILGKKVLSLKSDSVYFYFFLNLVWGFRTMLALFIEPWPLQPIPAAAIGQLCASVIIFVIMLIVSIILIKSIKNK